MLAPMMLVLMLIRMVLLTVNGESDEGDVGDAGDAGGCVAALGKVSRCLTRRAFAISLAPSHLQSSEAGVDGGQVTFPFQNASIDRH